MFDQQNKSNIFETVKEMTAGEDAGQILDKVIEYLHEQMQDWHWTGIYILIEDKLYLGPYRGPATEHTVIEVGKGVCGTAVKEEKNQIVDDVNTLENYIACSVGTSSEIVVLIKDGDEVLGQFDIDSDKKRAFSQEDERMLKEIANLSKNAVREYRAALMASLS